MKCNCNNINGGALEKPKISHVYGNVLRIAIPLTLRTVEKVNDEMVATDTDFIPSNEYPVKVVFAKSALKYSLDATMNGNIAYVEDKGKIPLGTYDITVTCNDDNGNPYRFNQATVLQVVNSTREAGIVSPIEYEVTTWYLDAAIFLALKGENGVGIDDIRTETSDEIGGMNTVTIYLTDGRTKSFTVMNGSGSVDNVLDILSPRPISNRAVTAKFNEIDARLDGLFGDVDYDSQSKEIRFWDKGKVNILARLDARPFIKDGMVSNVYISNNTLVITFNTDAGREAIGVPLSSVFNPNNYYTKVQVDNRLASLLENYYTKTKIDTKLSDKASINGDWVQDFTASCFNLWCTEKNDGLAVKIDADVDHSPDSAFIVFIDEYNYGGRLIYVFPQDTETRHIATEEYVQEYVSEHEEEGGSLEQVQSDWNVADTNSPAYIKNKPTIPVIPTNVSYFTNDAGYITQHQDISGKVDKETGKGLSSNDYTTAEKTKLAGIAEGATANMGTVQTVSVNGGTPVQPVNGNVNLIVTGIKGDKGDKGDTGNVEFEGLADLVALLVNDLTTGGPGNFLSAEMGKRLKAKVDEVEANVQRLYNNLGNIAFWDAAAKAAAAPIPIDWGNPKHNVTLNLSLTNAVVTNNGVAVTNGSVIQVEEFGKLTLIVEPSSSSYELSSVTSSTTGAVVTDQLNGTYKVEITMGTSNVTLAITAVANAAPVSVNFVESVSSNALSFSYSPQPIYAGDTLVGQFTIGSNYSGVQIVSVKDGNNNDVPYTLSGDTITIVNVPAALTITASAVNQLKIYKDKAFTSGGGVSDLTGCYITDYIKLDGLNSASALHWEHGRPVTNAVGWQRELILFYNSNKKLIYWSSGNNAKWEPRQYANKGQDFYRDVATNNLSNILSEAGNNVPVYARTIINPTYTHTAEGDIKGYPNITQGNTDFLAGMTFVEAPVSELNIHSITYHNNGASCNSSGNFIGIVYRPNAIHGENFETIITEDSGKTLQSVVVTMGGVNISDDHPEWLANKKIVIDSVTGDLDITVTAS